MRDPGVIGLIERRLAELGCPAARLRSTVRELSEHHQDLKQAALDEGLSEADAEARADHLLGEPADLAAHVASALRQASWWGRHPVIAFCLLPLPVMLLMAGLGAGLDFLVGRLYFSEDEVRALVRVLPGTATHIVLATWGVLFLLTAALFCLLAGRAARGLSWSLAACAACSLYSCCLHAQFSSLNFNISCAFPPALPHSNWLPFLAPLAVAAGAWWRRRQRLKRLPAPPRQPSLPASLGGLRVAKAAALLPLLLWRRGLGRGGRCSPIPSILPSARLTQQLSTADRFGVDLLSPTLSSKGGEGEATGSSVGIQACWQWLRACCLAAWRWLREFSPTALLNPSSIIASVAVAALSVAVFHYRSIGLQQIALDKEHRAKTWPAERAAVAQRLQGRQATCLAPAASTVSLQAWLNAALGDSFAGAIDTNRNHLAELPRGVHLFGGVPFDVVGRLQLAGRKLLDSTTAFPTHVRNIPIARKCARIHLLHGASDITPEMAGKNIARLVVHYSDGSQVSIPIIAGNHVRDWWGPIYKTDAGAQTANPSAPGSELAWAGSNPALKQQQPEWSLRLYKSTFDNPRPDRPITAIDYLSTLSDAAPFLVGLTVE